MSLSVKVVGNTNKLNSSKLINPTLKLVQTVLSRLEYEREWHVSFNTRIRSKADKKWITVRTESNAIRVKTKPGDNSTAWEILLMPPQGYVLQEIFDKLKRIHPQKLFLEDLPTTPVPAGPLRSRQETQARASSLASFLPLLSPHARSIFDEIKVATLGDFFDQVSLAQVQEHRGVAVGEEFCKLFRDYGIPLDDRWTTQNSELPFTLLLADCPYDEKDRRAMFNAIVATATECNDFKQAPRTAIANGIASSLFGAITPDAKKKAGSLINRMVDESWLDAYQIEGVGAGFSITPAGVEMIESFNLPDDIQSTMFEETAFAYHSDADDESLIDQATKKKLEKTPVETPAPATTVVMNNLDELAPLSKRMDELRRSQPAYDEEIDTLQSKITDNNCTISGVEAEIKRLQTELQRLMEKITVAEKANITLQEELESYASMKEDEAQEISELVKKIRAIVSP